MNPVLRSGLIRLGWTALAVVVAVGLWTYWIGFALCAGWATHLAWLAATPISDAGFAVLGLVLCWGSIAVVLIIGVVETAIRSRPTAAPHPPVAAPPAL